MAMEGKMSLNLQPKFLEEYSLVLTKTFIEEYRNNKGEMEESIEDAFLKVDHEIFQNVNTCEDCGSTATIGVIRYEGAKRVLYMANVGDSKAFICEDYKVSELTYEHRGNDEQEIKRVEEAGGKILVGRLEGFLAVTRALGDFSLKNKV